MHAGIWWLRHSFREAKPRKYFDRPESFDLCHLELSVWEWLARTYLGGGSRIGLRRAGSHDGQAPAQELPSLPRVSRVVLRDRSSRFCPDIVSMKARSQSQGREAKRWPLPSKIIVRFSEKGESDYTHLSVSVFSHLQATYCQTPHTSKPSFRVLYSSPICGELPFIIFFL